MRTAEVRPNVAGLRVDSHYALEAFGRRERRAVAKVEEVVVLQPLRQRLEVGHLPFSQPVPHCDGELLGLYEMKMYNF